MPNHNMNIEKHAFFYNKSKTCTIQFNWFNSQFWVYLEYFIGKINAKWLKIEWNCETSNQCKKKEEIRVGQLRCQISDYAEQTSVLCIVVAVDDTLWTILIVCILF